MWLISLTYKLEPGPVQSAERASGRVIGLNSGVKPG